MANNEGHHTVSLMWSLIPERSLIDCRDIICINQLINSAFILIGKNRIRLTGLGMLDIANIDRENRNSQIFKRYLL